MKKTVSIEVEIDIPEGYEYVKYRHACIGNLYLDNGVVREYGFYTPSICKHHILKKIKPVLKKEEPVSIINLTKNPEYLIEVSRDQLELIYALLGNVGDLDLIDWVRAVKNNNRNFKLSYKNRPDFIARYKSTDENMCLKLQKLFV